MKPFVKWAGGKTQLLYEIDTRLPQNYNKYIECFVGGGALYCYLKPGEAIINDKNRQLINCYIQIRDNADKLIKKLTELENKFNKLKSLEEKAAFFYEIREKFNKRMFRSKLSYIDASYFIFLNKSCYNGLYRINKSGLYNAPFGKKNTINCFEELNIKELAKELKRTTILNTDFEEACEAAAKGDFIFIDSPYYDTFDTYQSGGFQEADHIRLAELFKKLDEKGCYVMLTNSNTEFIKNLYKDFNIDIIQVKRMINSDANNRKGEEIIVRNYA